MRRSSTCRQLLFAAGFLFAVASVTAVGSLAGTVTYLAGEETDGLSEVVVVEDCALAHTAQLFSLDKEGSFIGEGSVDTQLAQVLFNLETALAATESGTEQLVKIKFYVDSAKTAGIVRKMLAKRFPEKGRVRPAVSWVLTPLADPRALAPNGFVGFRR